MAKARNKLIFYERQFNTIKGLIPVANSCISASIMPEKLVKKYFSYHMTYWDIIQSPKQKEIWKVELSQKEKYPLLERMVQMINLLVKVKKTSQAANLSQKSSKLTLFELLVRLRDQVLKETRAEIIPSFTLPKAVKPTSSLKDKITWPFPSMAKHEKKFFEMCAQGLSSTEIPAFFSKVLKKQLYDLYRLSHLGESQENQWANEINKYSSIQKRSLAAGKEYEGKAYEIICNMHAVNQSLNQSIRDEANPQYENFIIKMEDMIEYFKEKERKKED